MIISYSRNLHYYLLYLIKMFGVDFIWKRWFNKRNICGFSTKLYFQKYKRHLLVLDNARAHNNNLVKQSILDSGNKYLFTVPYTPKTNAIEMWFNQIKHTLKLNKKVLKFNELKLEVKKSIRKVKTNNYENYFEYAYNKSKSYKLKR